MRVTMQFSLPDDEGDFQAALHGREALTALWEIDQRLRSMLKHGDPGEQEARLAEEVRSMIPYHLMEL